MNEPKFVCWCDMCGTDLYEGSFCYRLEGLYICPDCLRAYALRYFRSDLELLL